MSENTFEIKERQPKAIGLSAKARACLAGILMTIGVAGVNNSADTPQPANIRPKEPVKPDNTVPTPTN